MNTQQSTLTSRRTLFRAAAIATAGAGVSLAMPTVAEAAPRANDIARRYHRKSIEWMLQTGVSRPNSRGQFRPTAPLTRDVMAVWMWRFAGSPRLTMYRGFFRDVPKSHRYALQIEWAFGQGILFAGHDGRLRPSARVRRDEAAAYFHRMLSARLSAAGLDFKTGGSPRLADISSGSRFSEEIRWMYASGITRGVNGTHFRPARTVRREEMAAFLHRSANLANRAV